MMAERLPVAVVVVTWNSAADVEACLRSVEASGARELVVVDNASTDGTTQVVASRFPRAKLLPQAANIGFAAGCNLGIRETSAPYVLLLNADAVLEPTYVARLLAALELHLGAAAAVGKLVAERGGRRSIDSAGINLRRFALSPLDRGLGEPDRAQYDVPCEVFGPSAAAALYRRSALDELGLEPFDPELFAYYEDVDLAWRLRRAGWKHLYVPTAVARHDRKGPDGKPPAIAARAFVNRYVVFIKNESPWRFAAYAGVALPWETARVMRRAWRRPRFLGELWSQRGRVVRALRARLFAQESRGPIGVGDGGSGRVETRP